MTRSYHSPLGRWLEKMDTRIRREELRAVLGQARANARKWGKKKASREGAAGRDSWVPETSPVGPHLRAESASSTRARMTLWMLLSIPPSLSSWEAPAT
jgi:hypothetical protein